LYWKEDGNDLTPRVPTKIFAQQLGGHGTELIGERRVVLENDLGWEGHVVEGPWAVRRGRWVYLFYSGNAYDTAHYATGVARAMSPLGPFEKRGEPILARNEAWGGPGHGCLVRHRRQDWFVYHAWERDRVSGGHPRVALVSHVRWDEGWPSIDRTIALPAMRCSG
jgi:beta-xylosidase